MLKVQHFKGLIINLNVNKGLINAFSRLSKKKKKKEKERKKKLEQGDIYVRKERNKRKVVSGSDKHGMQATPHRLFPSPERIKARERQGSRKRNVGWKLITFRRFSTRGKESRGLSFARIIARRGKLTFQKERIYYIIVLYVVTTFL